MGREHINGFKREMNTRSIDKEGTLLITDRPFLSKLPLPNAVLSIKIS